VNGAAATRSSGRTRRVRPRTAASLLAAVVLLAAAGTAEADPDRPRRGPVERVGRLIEEWRFEEAQAEVERLLATAPGEPSTLYLDAVARYHRGDYDGAAARLDELGKRGGRGLGGDVKGLADLVASTRAATRGFVEVRSSDGHFIVRHQPGRDELLVPYALEALAAARREIGLGDFGAGALLDGPVLVEIYPQVTDLARVSTLTQKEIETSGTIAICKFNRLMIASPRALVHGYPWLDTLAHEFTHLVVTRVSRNTVPIWLHEGLAKYEERRWRLARIADAPLSPSMEHLLAAALGKGRRLITFEEMSPSMAKLPSQEDTALAFAEVYTVIEYLLSRRGWDGVRALLTGLREGHADGEAMSAVVGQPFDEFQRGWRSWLRARKLRVHPGLVPTALKFARAGAARRPDGRDDDEAQEVAEERARKLVRLGGLLREKGRTAAAAVEYERALELVGPGHVVVANRLARALLSLGDLDGAIAAATPAFILYPDSGGAAAVLGEAWSRKGDADRAAGYLEAALSRNPFDPAPHCALAPIYEARHDARAAREHGACAALQRATVDP
jgi:tetratricopeptide (TPR) repeat protein